MIELNLAAEMYATIVPWLLLQKSLYSALVDEHDTLLCFLYFQEIREWPRNY